MSLQDSQSWGVKGDRNSNIFSPVMINHQMNIELTEK